MLKITKYMNMYCLFQKLLRSSSTRLFMNRKFIFLTSVLGLSVLIGACQPAETPTTTPPEVTPASPAPAVPPATPATP